MLSAALCRTYENILIEELRPAMGCTEPIAIAYAAAILRDALGADPVAITVGLSGNIIKNVKSVIVPSTGGMHGIETAVAAGVVAACPEKKLELLGTLTEADRARIAPFKDACRMTVDELVTPCTFDLSLRGEVDGHTARVRISEHHTNVVLVERDGVELTADYAERGNAADTADGRADRTLLNVKDIVDFATEADLTRVTPYLRRQIEMNMAIAEEGLRNTYGASIGKLLYRDGEADLRTRAKAFAAAGSDARMSGCELPVCILSGSGNQGITASVPVVVFAREKGASEEELLRALVAADLITVHLKTGIGCLSAYCGAISAGCGSGAGICFLDGGRYYEIAHTVVNAVAILSGTICDGAKASCAAKIAMAVEAGLMGYEMTCTKRQFYGGDGIVTKGVENTIRNVGKLARDGMCETDKEIIRIMLGKAE
ncbi:MAG: serine dehydratase subunit alpha family protein [Ruminococcaceae bacterium]|nr:serine dehydratase subunit alpha family protein [Oscillospiraceae bacterium]